MTFQQIRDLRKSSDYGKKKKRMSWLNYQRFWAVKGKQFQLLQNFPSETASVVLCSFCSREISLEEAQVLVAALNSEDIDLLSEILSSVSNYAAFTVNQNRLRECGLIAILPKLLLNNSNRQIKQKVCHVVSNMALNDKNHLGNGTCL